MRWLGSRKLLSSSWILLAAADVLDDAPDDVVKLEPGLESDERPDLRNIRDAPRHVLEPHLVGLIVRDVLNRRVAAREVPDPIAQTANRTLVRVAAVGHFAHGARLARDRDERLDDATH